MGIALEKTSETTISAEAGPNGSGWGTKMDDQMVLESSTREAAGLLKALGNEHRLMILCKLLEGEKCVGELVRLIGLSQSALSQHLARLRRDRLVRTRRSAQTIYYALADSQVRAVLTMLGGLYCHSNGHHAPVYHDRVPVTVSREPPQITV